MRWPGVLQRIALCYFFAALIVLHTRWRTQAILVARGPARVLGGHDAGPRPGVRGGRPDDGRAACRPGSIST